MRGAKTPPGQVDAVDFSPPARSRGSERAPLSPISAAITRACQLSPPAHLNPLGPPTRARQPSPPLFSSSSRHALPLPQLPPTTTTLPPQAPQPKTPQSFDICRAALAAPHAFLHPPLPLAEIRNTHAASMPRVKKADQKVAPVAPPPMPVAPIMAPSSYSAPPPMPQQPIQPYGAPFPPATPQFGGPPPMPVAPRTVDYEQFVRVRDSVSAAPLLAASLCSDACRHPQTSILTQPPGPRALQHHSWSHEELLG